MSFFHLGSLKLTWMVAGRGEYFGLALLHGCTGFSDTLSAPTQTHSCTHLCRQYPKVPHKIKFIA